MKDNQGVAASPPGCDPSGSAVPASCQHRIPNAVDAAYDRLHKFAVEWKFMQRCSSYDGYVYELHPGDPRHAVCKIDDIITLLEAVNGD